MKFDYIARNGDILSLTNDENFKLVNIDAQTAVTSDISSMAVGGMDGDLVNNIQAQPRTIVLDLRILHDVELTKRRILDIIKLKQKGKIRWEQANKTVVIEGIIEAIEMPRWNNEVMMQVTMHCDQPFWEDVDDFVAEINDAINLHYFTEYKNDMLYFPVEGIPFGEIDMLRSRGINNAGDVAVGMDIEITAVKTCTNPIIYASDGSYFGCGHGTGSKKVVMQAGDIIKIRTVKGEKGAMLNGVSILNKIKPNSTWLQLEAGPNTFSIDADEDEIDNMIFNLTYKRRYV